MPSGNHTPVRKPAANPARKKRRLRGPVIRFRFSVLILIWLFSLLLCFGHYMYDRNYHPEKDVFVKKAVPSESSKTVPAENSEPVTPADSKAEPVSQAPAESQAAEESSGTVVPTKINPVPESAPQDASYLEKCAFFGDMTIHRFGEAGLLGAMNVYSSETLNLNNYDTEYITIGDGTTIRILSMANGAQCPIYLMFGTESLAAGKKADQIADKFSGLLYAIKSRAPSSNIYIMSIPPVAAAAEKAKPAVLNTEIDAYNSRLLELANQANVYYVDTNLALRSKQDGKLNAEYAEQDGIHLTAEAGRIILDYVLKHVPNA